MTLVLDLAKVDSWIAKGAQPSETVGKLIATARGGAATMGGKTGPKAAAKGFTAPGTRPAAVEETVVVEAAPQPDAAADASGSVDAPATEAPAAVAAEPVAGEAPSAPTGDARETGADAAQEG